MDWITDTIAIGNYLEAQDAELLRRNRIRAVLSLDRTLQATVPSSLGLTAIEAVPLDDGPGNDPRLFERAVSALVSLCKDHAPVLVQCHAGRSRSAVVVAGYFMRTQGIEADEALALVAAKREINVTPGLEALLDRLS
jgi:hypothetical protein